MRAFRVHQATIVCKADGKAALCADHAQYDMVNVVSRICGHGGCTKQPSYGKAGGKAELCADHAKDGMVNVVTRRRCGDGGCTKRPSYGKAAVRRQSCVLIMPRTAW